MIYLLNTPILTSYGTFEFSGPLSIEQVNELLADGFVSAIGHSATADVMSELLNRKIKAERRKVKMEVGDSAVVFRLLERLPEGIVLSKCELLELPFELSMLFFKEL